MNVSVIGTYPQEVNVRQKTGTSVLHREPGIDSSAGWGGGGHELLC